MQSNPTSWNLAPGTFTDPANLFSPSFTNSTRGAMTLEALRQIIGDGPFFELAQTWLSENRDGNASTANFVALAKRVARDSAGFDPLRTGTYAKTVVFTLPTTSP